MELGNAAEAETAFRKALALATEADDVEGLVQTANRLAALAVWRNAPREADEIVNAARARAERARRPDLVLYLVTASAVRFANSGELARAEEEYLRLAELASAGGFAEHAPERRGAEAASLAGRITLRLRRQDLAGAALLAPRLRARLADLGTSELVRDLVLLSQVGMLSCDLDEALTDAVRAVELSGGDRLRPEQTQALAQLASVHMMRCAYEPAHRTCLAALSLIEDSRATVGDAQSRVAFVTDRSELYQQAVRLCLILADTFQDPAYRTEALTWVERIKSRTLGELMGLGGVDAPTGVPAHVVEAEHELVRRVRVHESAGGMSRHEYHEAWRRLEALWREMEDAAPEYVALRRGRSARPDQIRELLGGPDRTAAAGAVATGPDNAQSRPAAAWEAPLGTYGAPPRDPLGAYGAAREVEIALPGSGSRRVLILPETHADSRRRMVDRISRPTPVDDRLVDLVRNLAAVDAAWWTRYEAAVAGGRVPDAEQLGELLRCCVARWGSADQRRAADRWGDGRLVSRLCRALAVGPPDEACWAPVRSVLRKDREAVEACRVLHDRRLLPVGPAAAALAREKDRLSTYFFDCLAQEVRAASRGGPAGAAAARFRLGVQAAVLLVPGDARLLAAGAAFIEDFPEHRYA
ncbi:hypothetical protein [Streptomyces cirratus]